MIRRFFVPALVLTICMGYVASLTTVHASPVRPTTTPVQAYTAQMSRVFAGFWRATASIGSASFDVHRSVWSDADRQVRAAAWTLSKTRSGLRSARVPVQMRALHARCLRAVTSLLVNVRVMRQGIATRNVGVFESALSAYKKGVTEVTKASAALSILNG
jgi:hypothetical protein